MRKKILASVAALAAGAGLAWGQAPMAGTAEPVAMSASGMPMLDPNVTPTWFRQPLYLQGGPGCGPAGCPAGGCNAPPLFGGDCGGGGEGCGGPGFTPRGPLAAGGPDCFYFDVEGIW